MQGEPEKGVKKSHMQKDICSYYTEEVISQFSSTKVKEFFLAKGRT
jgi:hypothetical protein